MNPPFLFLLAPLILSLTPPPPLSSVCSNHLWSPFTSRFSYPYDENNPLRQLNERNDNLAHDLSKYSQSIIVKCMEAGMAQNSGHGSKLTF